MRSRTSRPELRTAPPPSPTSASLRSTGPQPSPSAAAPSSVASWVRRSCGSLPRPPCGGWSARPACYWPCVWRPADWGGPIRIGECAPRSVPTEQVVDRVAARAGDDVAVVAVEQLVRRAPEAGAGAELDGGDGDVERVDEASVEELADGVGAAAEPDVLAVGRGEGLLQHLRGRAV